MLKTLALSVYLMLFSFSLLAGTEIQNGGTGLMINGKVATFYSAKINIIPSPLVNTEGMSELLTKISTLNVDSKTKFELIKSISPSTNRNYYRVANDDPNSPEIKSIIAEYERVTHIDGDELTLFGITNPQTQTTLLFPSFFKLSATEKMAILFHESMWMTNRVTSIEEMVTLEYLFQKYLEINDNESIYDFYGELGKLYENRGSWQFYATLAAESNLFLKNHPELSSISFDHLINLKVLPTFTNYLLNKNDQYDSAQDLIVNLQNELSNSSDPFYYSKASLKNYLIKSTTYNGVILSIDDSRILSQDRYNYGLALSKLQNSYFKGLNDQSFGFIPVFYNNDSSEMFHFFPRPEAN
jgi:hypothetical protein